MPSRDTSRSDGPRFPRDIRERAESLWLSPRFNRDRPDIMPNGLMSVIVYSCSRTGHVEGSHDGKENILRSKRKIQPLHSKGQRYSLACPPDRSPLAKAAGVRALTCPLKDVQSHQGDLSDGYVGRRLEVYVGRRNSTYMFRPSLGVRGSSPLLGFHLL